jgi:hypothetical protein
MRKFKAAHFRSTAAAMFIFMSAETQAANGLVPFEFSASTVSSPSAIGETGTWQVIPFRQPAADMRLEGEDAARDLTFHLSPNQVSAGGLLRLSYTNAVSVLPDDGLLDVELNGKPLATFPIRSPNGPTTHDIPVAASDLAAGWNTVRIRVRQHHRIDCSVNATYELWTQVDPLVSGFVSSVEPKDGNFASLLAVGRNGERATEIRLIARPEAFQTTVQDSLALLQTLSLILGRDDLVVSVGNAPGTGPGIDLHVGDPADTSLPQAARDALAGAPRGLFVRQGDGGRLSVTMRASGKDEAQALLVSAANGPLMPLIRQKAAASSGAVIDGREPGVHPLSKIGYRTAPFQGRLFQTSFDVIMPADFYPGDYGTVDLHLNAATAPGLAPGTQLLVRVNERAVASHVLYDPEGTTLKDKPLELPLRAFHPGVNHVRILAELPAATDLACDPAMRDETRSRFLMLQETTVTIPPLARAGRLPDLAAFAGSSFPFTGSNAFGLHLDAPTPARLGSALTLLVRMAISAGHPLPAELKVGQPDPAKSTNALIVSATGDILEQVSLGGEKGNRLGALRTDDLTTASISTGTPVSESEALLKAFQVETRLDDDQLSWKSRMTEWFARASTTVNRWLSYKEIGRDDVHVDALDRLISIRQLRAPESKAVWTVVSAADEAALLQGVSTLTRPEKWTELQGGEALVRRSDLALVTRQPEAYGFFPITDTSFANLRRLAAAWLSDNFLVYVGVVLILMGGFGWWLGYVVPRKGVRTIE